MVIGYCQTQTSVKLKLAIVNNYIYLLCPQREEAVKGENTEYPRQKNINNPTLITRPYGGQVGTAKSAKRLVSCQNLNYDYHDGT